MALMRVTSPHAHGPLSTARVMQYVLLATVPGIIVLTHFFGFGTVVNILALGLTGYFYVQGLTTSGKFNAMPIPILSDIPLIGPITSLNASVSAGMRGPGARPAPATSGLVPGRLQCPGHRHPAVYRHASLLAMVADRNRDSLLDPAGQTEHQQWLGKRINPY